jgi:hypothetical protein
MLGMSCFAMSVAEIAVVSFVELMKVVGRVAPLKFTMEPVTKFEPFTTSVNPAAPATTLEGTMDEVIGAGLTTANAIELEAPPPGSGLKTKTIPEPPFATSVLRISAVS